MRSSLAFVLLVAACSSSKGGGGGGGVDAADPNGTPAFDITSTDITLNPGQEVTYCYYFHTPNTVALPIDKWVSDMTPGSHHMILFTGGPSHADGLDMTNSCGLGTSTTNVAKWVYASQTSHQEQDLPADDGTGKPLAQLIEPNTEAAFQMHYLNTTDTPLTAHVELKAYALATGAAYTQTDAYITYNQSISIPPGATNYTVSATCTVPTQSFWTVSTHDHKQGIHTDIKDGATTVFQSTDWEHPGAQVWNSSPFYSFSGGTLTWECTYNNTGSNSTTTVTAGPSAQTNEMCMAVGYFFPATGPQFCLYDDQIPTADHCYCQ